MQGSWYQCHASVLIYFVSLIEEQWLFSPKDKQQSRMQASSFTQPSVYVYLVFMWCVFGAVLRRVGCQTLSVKICGTSRSPSAHPIPLKQHCFHDSLCVTRLMKYGCSFPIYQQNTPDTTMLYFSFPKVHSWTLDYKYKIAYKYLLNMSCYISGWCKSEYNDWEMDAIWPYILLTCCYQSLSRLLSWRSRHTHTHTHSYTNRPV